jgi:tetratricopeptide (TPR) repeat protein
MPIGSRLRFAGSILIVVFAASTALWFWRAEKPRSQKLDGTKTGTDGYVGSKSCRDCHERFYALWSTSHHGLAMQPYSAELARRLGEAGQKEVTVTGQRYRAEVSPAAGFVIALSNRGGSRFPIVHALGGKNVFYFLTPQDRGKLQVLPLAFDVNKKEWFDATGSMVRHFIGAEDRRIDWKDPLLTFNTSCYSCHVSQLSTNYDLKTDTYRTTWAEPGINCETCHGPAGEHVRLFSEAAPGKRPAALGLISNKTLTHQQRNDTCAPCHAKMMIVKSTFTPGSRYFDHFDLATLESQDFYPDGRDLGENYTFTSWRMSPCAKSGMLDCVYCHTSSGRFRFKNEDPNGACMMCHAEKVTNLTEHTRHKPNSSGSLCISCHMPMTEFARMRRSDHSMLPPAPAATIAFKSPNACNICHSDRNAAWADRYVRAWRKRDYQKPVLYRAGLIAAARRGDWARLTEMLEYVTGAERDEVFAASLVRLLETCPNERKWPAIRKAAQDPSPLVRGAAAQHLGASLTTENRDALLQATRDEYRLVRVRAARSLAQYPTDQLSAEDRKSLDAASQELVASFQSRPDDWTSYFNLGSYYLDRNEPQRALASFEIAITLRPDVVMPYVNASIAQARLGRNAEAGSSLRKALEIEPESAAVNFNLGLLEAENQNLAEAEKYLRAALKANSAMAEAAYNLGVLVARDRLEEAIAWCRKAVALQPESLKYGYTLAFYLNEGGRTDEAIRQLQALIARHPENPDAWALLAAVLEKRGQVREAQAVYRKASNNKLLPERDRLLFEEKLKNSSGRQ